MTCLGRAVQSYLTPYTNPYLFILNFSFPQKVNTPPNKSNHLKIIYFYFFFSKTCFSDSINAHVYVCIQQIFININRHERFWLLYLVW